MFEEEIWSANMTMNSAKIQKDRPQTLFVTVLDVEREARNLFPPTAISTHVRVVISVYAQLAIENW
jgi:hypothetical protein